MTTVSSEELLIILKRGWFPSGLVRCVHLAVPGRAQVPGADTHTSSRGSPTIPAKLILSLGSGIQSSSSTL